MKAKKLLSSLISISMLAGALPVMAAYTTADLTKATRDYVYKNDYSADTIQAVNYGFDLSLTADPDDETNQVLKVTDADGIGNGKSYKYNILATGAGSAGSIPTYESQGLDKTRNTYLSADVYLPTGLLTDLGNNGSLSIWMPVYTAHEDNTKILPVTVKKTAGADTFTLTCSTDGFGVAAEGVSKTIEPDTWFNVRYQHNFGSTSLYCYINNERVGGVWKGWTYADNVIALNCEGVGVRFAYKGAATTTDGTTTYAPLTTGFLVDNAGIYRWAEQSTVYSITDGQTDVKPDEAVTVTFGCDVSAYDLSAKFTATDGAGNATTLTPSVSGNTATLDISSLEYSTEYTLAFGGFTDSADEIYIPKSQVTFTTYKKSALEIDTATYMYKDSFNDATVNKGRKYAKHSYVNDDVAKLLGEDNYAMNIATSSTGKLEVTLSNNPIDGSGTTYQQDSGTATGQIVWTWDMYVKDTIMANLGKTSTTKAINIAPMNPSNQWATYGSFMNYLMTLNAAGNTVVYQTYNDLWDDIDPFKLNRWNNVTWVADTTNKTLRVYVNGVLEQSYDTLKDSNTNNGTFGLSKYNKGIQIIAGTELGTVPENVLYVDNAAIYRAAVPLSATYEFDNLARTGKIKFTSPVKPEQAKYIKITTADGNTVPATIEFDADGLVATTTFEAGTLENNTAYKVVIDYRLQDKYMQYIANTDTVIDFETGDGPREDVKKYIYNDSFNTKGGNGDGMTVALSNDPEDSSNKVMKITAENAKHSWLTSSIAEFGPVKGWADATYASYGMVDDRTLFGESKFYLPASILTEMDTRTFQIGLGVGAANEPWNIGNVKLTANNDDTAFILKTANGETTVNADEWFTLSWRYQPGATTARVYLNDTLIDASASCTYYNGNITSASAAKGVIFVVPNGTNITDGVFVDDVKLYQMTNAIAIDNLYYDAETEEAVIDFATNVNADQLSKITLKLNGIDVSSLITTRTVEANAHVVRLGIPFENLAISTEYAIAVPSGFADANGQILKTAIEQTFTTPKSKSVYVDTYTFTAPTTAGASMNVTINNSGADTSAWVVMAVYGEYNELIALDDVSFDVVNSEQNFDLSVTADCSKAKEVRLYVWDSAQTMVPLQKNELIWSSLN